MKPLPHTYTVTALSSEEKIIKFYSDAVTTIEADAPPEFDGSEKYWSPETLLAGAVSSCYALTFGGMARKANLRWDQLHTEVRGKLERNNGQTRFTEFTINARLELPADQDEAKAESILKRAEELCLITNSILIFAPEF